MNSSQVSVIIPVFNNWQLTQNCLTSLRATTNGESLEVLVVDNGSSDETAKELLSFGQNLFGKDFKRIRFEENRNFAPACNAGAKEAKGDFLFFLNNDTELLLNWLPPLLKEFEITPHLGTVGPLLMYPDKTVQHLGITVTPEGKVIHLYCGLPIFHPLAQRKRFFHALTAAALLIPRKIFLEENGFDERFINEFEDVDFGLRLFSHGYKHSCVPESKIVHMESKTPNRFSHSRENNSLLQRKWQHELFHLIDMPDLVAADGYALRILPNLQPQLNVSKAESQKLIQQTCNPAVNLVKCFALLEKEPYWQDGYLLLSKCLEQIGDFRTALQICFMQGQYTWYSVEILESILRIERHLNIDTANIKRSFAYNFINIINAPIWEEIYTTTVKALSEGTPAQKALIPQYVKARHEAHLIRAKYPATYQS